MGEKAKKRKFVMPDTYVIIVLLLIVACIFTYIIPAGEYDLVEGTKMVDAASFHFVEQNPATLMDFLNSFMEGLQKGATTIFIVFMVGGAFQVLMDTGSVDAVLTLALKKTQNKYEILIATVAVVMSVLGALGVGNNVALAFIPIMLILCRKLRLDAIVAVGMLYLASTEGFAGSPMNPFSVLLAQNIAEIPQMSGFLERAVMWCIFTAIVIAGLIRYCHKIRKNPEKSLTGILTVGDGNVNIEDEVMEVKPIHMVNMCILVGIFVIYAYGGIKYNWGLSTLGTMMVAMTFLIALVSRISPNQVSKSFINGAKTMIYSALMIGFASGISVILGNGKIIHSIIYFLTKPLMELPKFIAAVGMFFINFIFNFFVNSGSGQCYVVMPLMTPAADVLEISRQVAISAYQFGDGISNVIYPTSGLMMGCIGAAKIPYDKWVRFALPIVGVISIAATIFLILMTVTGWS